MRYPRRARPRAGPPRAPPAPSPPGAAPAASPGAGAGAARRASTRSDSANNTGVAAIDSAITSVASPATRLDRAPAAVAAANSTKLNSLPCGRASPKRSAVTWSWPRIHPSP